MVIFTGTNWWREEDQVASRLRRVIPCARSPLFGAAMGNQLCAIFSDRLVSPRDDFFHYAVGKWLKAHPIPPFPNFSLGAHLSCETLFRERGNGVAGTLAFPNGVWERGGFGKAVSDPLRQGCLPAASARQLG
jgi:hypothetical protein